MFCDELFSQVPKSVASKIWMSLCKISRIGQYLGHLKGYEGQILCMDTPSTKLLIFIFVAMRNRLPWQQRDISISQLSEGVEGPDLVKR